MKLVTFETNGRRRVGAWHDGRVYDLNAAAKLAATGPQHVADSVKELLAAGLDGLATARAALQLAFDADAPALAGVAFDRAAVTLLAPVPDPSKVIAIGLNYRDHCTEQNIPVPEVMTVFAKFPSAVIGDGQPIRLPSRELTQQVDYEAELAVVIGRQGVDIPREQAYDYVAGYTICHDVSARDVQFGDGGKQWIHGKSFDTFCPLGPWLVTRDEIPDPHTLAISFDLNGQRVQESSTRHLVFDVPYLISELSRSITLHPGDVISTGTPGGVGVFRTPPLFLKDGDVCRVTIERIGTLTNPVVG